MIVQSIKIVFVIVLCIIWYNTGYQIGKTAGYSKGVDKGIGLALDTVYKIIEKQVDNDSIVTHFTIAHPDTVGYFLSAKTIKP
jgi:hypothetical protein